MEGSLKGTLERNPLKEPLKGTLKGTLKGNPEKGTLKRNPKPFSTYSPREAALYFRIASSNSGSSVAFRPGVEISLLGFGFRVLGFGFRVLGLGFFGVYDVGIRV